MHIRMQIGTSLRLLTILKPAETALLGLRRRCVINIIHAANGFS